MVPEDQVRAELKRILESSEFAHAARLSRFLRFVVEKTIAGDGGHLKEYIIAVEVFDRSQDFDPRMDPIVRVEARRLRAKLQEYYEGTGRDDAVRILFRKGGYEPAFEQTEASPPVSVVGGVNDGPVTVASPPNRKVSVFIGLVLLGAIALFLVWSKTSNSQQTLTIATSPSSDSGNAEFADGLAEALCVELARNPNLRVIAWPAYTEYRARHENPTSISPQELKRDLGADVVLMLSVRENEQRRRVIAHFMSPQTGAKLWAGDYERGMADTFAIQRELARAIAEEVRNSIAKIANLTTR